MTGSSDRIVAGLLLVIEGFLFFFPFFLFVLCFLFVCLFNAKLISHTFHTHKSTRHGLWLGPKSLLHKNQPSSSQV